MNFSVFKVISQAWSKNVKCISNDIRGESDSLEIGSRADRTSAKVQSVQIWHILKRDNFCDVVERGKKSDKMASNVTDGMHFLLQTEHSSHTPGNEKALPLKRDCCIHFLLLLICPCLQLEWCFSYFMFGLLLWAITPKHFSKIGCGVICCGSASWECNPNAQQQTRQRWIDKTDSKWIQV